MNVDRRHCFDKDYIVKKKSYFLIAIALFLVGCYALYYGLNDLIKSYDLHSQAEFSFFERLFDRVEDRILPMFIFLVSMVLLVISILRKNNYKQVFISNYLEYYVDTGKVQVLSEINTHHYFFGRVKKFYQSKIGSAFNLHKISDFAFVEKPDDAKAKRLGIRISGGSHSSTGRVSSMVNFNVPSNLNPVSVHKAEVSKSSGFLTRLYLIYPNKNYEMIIGCAKYINQFLLEYFADISSDSKQ